MQQGKSLEPMSSIDRFWLSMDEPANLMVITGLMEFDEPLDHDAVCALLQERLLLSMTDTQPNLSFRNAGESAEQPKTRRSRIRKNVCWSPPLALGDVKEIGLYFRCTVNDVLMAAVAGAGTLAHGGAAIMEKDFHFNQR